jgi:mercuric ion binding protein
MKTQSTILTIAFVLISIFSIAQDKPAVKSETIKVWGNCGMCKTHIEKAAKEAGATTAIWNKDKKILTVKYDVSKTDNQKIQKSVADAGYDTKDFTGSDEAYKNLEECCQYDRKAATKKQ